MGVEVSSIVTGKVTGITNFGAFIQLPDGQSGMVHISEIANTYVEDIRQHLKEGQEVTVKVLEPDRNGRLNLSIKKAQPPPSEARPVMPVNRGARQPANESLSFEDKLKVFMQVNDNKAAEPARNERRKKDKSRDVDDDDYYDDFE